MLEMAPAKAAVATAHDLGMTVRAHISSPTGLQFALEAGVDAVEHLPLHPMPAREKLETLFQSMVDKGIILVPTLDALTRGTWDNAPVLDMVNRFKQLGGRIALGTDAPFLRVAHGFPLREMELLHEAGLSPQEVLEAATRTAALACGAADRGMLAPGLLADVLVVHGAPLVDLHTLRAPELVILGGKVVFSRLAK